MDANPFATNSFILFALGGLAVVFFYRLRTLDPSNPLAVYKLLAECFFLIMAGPVAAYAVWTGGYDMKVLLASLPAACICTAFLAHRIMKKKI